MIKIKALRKMMLIVGMGASLFQPGPQAHLFAQVSENSTGGNPAMNCLSEVLNQGNSCQPEQLQELRNCLNSASSLDSAAIPADIQNQTLDLISSCEQCVAARSSQDATHFVSLEGGTDDDRLAPFRDAAARESRGRIERRFPGLDAYVRTFEDHLRNSPNIPPAERARFQDLLDYYKRLRDIQAENDPAEACRLIRQHNEAEIARLKNELERLSQEIEAKKARWLDLFNNPRVQAIGREVARQTENRGQLFTVLDLPPEDMNLWNEYTRARDDYNNSLRPYNELAGRIRSLEARLDQCEVYLRPWTPYRGFSGR